MLRIRFRRVGKKKQPTYRLVVSERGRTPIAKAKDEIGFYNPHTKQVGIDADRAKHWLSVGAQPSKTVHNLFVRQGLIEGKKIAVHSQPKKSEEDIAKEAEAAKAATAKPSTPEASKEEKPVAEAAETVATESPAPVEAKEDKPATESPAADKPATEEAKAE